MLDKYLNKQVVIEEKKYGYKSGACDSNVSTEGIITAIDDDFIELNNNVLIARKFIYKIIIK